jgi:hypothetical protein
MSEPDIADHVALSSEPSAKLWLFLMIETMKEVDLVRMVVTLWAIWHAKRKAVHEDIFQSPMATMGFVNRFLADLELSRPAKQPKKVHSPSPIRSAVRWLGLPAGKTKINTDAAIAKTKARGAVGVVCRSEGGVFLGALAVVFDGVTNPGSLEALACREGLALADDLGIGPLHLATDCLNVVQGLRDGDMGEYSSILLEIRSMASLRGGTTFGHERREFNEEAHRLARFASSLPVGRYVWLLEPPIELQTRVNAVTV